MDSIDTLKTLFVRIVKYSFVLQSACALILMITFVPRHGVYGIFMAVFTSSSAFCNAGFDVMGIEGANIGFLNYANNPLVILPVVSIIILGGLGFVVWQDLLMLKKTRRIAFHSKVVLTMTAIMLAAGFTAYLFALLTDPQFSKNTLTEKILSALLTSTASRTAGMSAIPINLSADFTLVVTIILMFIGTSPGSTGGGTKVTTWAILFATISSVIANREDVVLFGHKIKKSVVYKTLTVLALSLFIVFALFTVVFLSKDSDLRAVDIMYDIVSAFTTTGYSTNLAAHSGSLTFWVLISAMFIGRIGPVSLMLSLSMSRPENRPEILPESEIMVG